MEKDVCVSLSNTHGKGMNLCVHPVNLAMQKDSGR